MIPYAVMVFTPNMGDYYLTIFRLIRNGLTKVNKMFSTMFLKTHQFFDTNNKIRNYGSV